MKNQITKKLLLSLMLCNPGFAAVGLCSPANPPQAEIPAKKQTQLGSGHAPYPPQAEIPAKKQTQLGSGHAPHPPQAEIPAKKQTQPGSGHAPHPPQAEIEVHR